MSNEHEFDLFWHALNYRGAATLHAQSEWEALEACVERLKARAVNEFAMEVLRHVPADVLARVIGSEQQRAAIEKYGTA